MKRPDASVALGVAVAIVFGSLLLFAIELSNTQAKSRRDVTARVHERAVLAGALIDSLFQTVEQQLPQDTARYGARTVSVATLNRRQGQDLYIAVLGSSGRVLAASRGFTAQAQADIKRSAALALIRAGHPYGLGNLLPYKTVGAIDFAVAFPTPYGKRILLTGVHPGSLSAFITGELRKIPGVKGAHNYLLDGNDAVIASTNPEIPPGHVFSAPGQRQRLAHGSGDHNGHYFDQVDLSNSTWRVLLAAPNGPLFASVTGLRKWVPWVIFIAFALAALSALALGRRSLMAAEEVHAANARLEALNGQLERRAAELARSNSDLQQFASIASHDLQEPLRKVRTFAEQLTVFEADRLSDKGRDYLARTNSAAERMQQLIEDLLKFSRVATHGRPFAPVDLAQVTAEVLDDLEAQVERTGAAVKVEELPTISGDALQMRQLMQNLISNALKFHRNGVPPEVSIAGSIHDGVAMVTVSDNGIGFEQQYSRRIFRVFERLHGRSEFPGTGIGLALCRKIAERHGGSVVADSEVGVGSTFTLTLPVNQREEVIVAVPSGDTVGSLEPEMVNVVG